MMGLKMAMDSFAIEGKLAMVSEPTDIPVYDFDLRRFFACSSRTAGLPGVARVGAIDNYANFYQECLERDVQLVNSPEQQRRTSRLPEWYPLLEGKTPRSRWYSSFPPAGEVEAEFGWPVFLKGARQTSRHGGQSIVHSPHAFAESLAAFQADPILHWQELVVREFVPLRPIGQAIAGKLPPSFEFRTFWWFGTLVGAGTYWGGWDYRWSDAEKVAALRLGAWAAKQVGTPFMVVDLAMTATGEWIVIECNDAMESGYAGVSPLGLWQSVLDASRPDQHWSQHAPHGA